MEHFRELIGEQKKVATRKVGDTFDIEFTEGKTSTVTLTKQQKNRKIRGVMFRSFVATIKNGHMVGASFPYYYAEGY